MTKRATVGSGPTTSVVATEASEGNGTTECYFDRFFAPAFAVKNKGGDFPTYNECMRDDPKRCEAACEKELATLRGFYAFEEVPEDSLPTGTYHLDRGYLYMRTLDSCHVLFGGGRHWGISLPLPPERDVESEAHWDAALEQAANRWVEVEAVTHRWTGWLGVGRDRRPLIGESQPGLYHAVRMGGMGVAIGTGVGRQLAEAMTRV